MNDETFKQNLADGIKGEDAVYEYLITTHSFVEDNRHQKYEARYGPRLRGIEGTLALPDFTVYDKFKGNFAVDVKVKTSVYTIDGFPCFTVDYKYLDYLRIVQLKKLDYLALAFVFQNKLYWYKDSEMFGTTQFNNQYSKGDVYLFAKDENKVKYTFK